MNNLQRRAAVAAIGIPIGIAIIYIGDALLAALLGVMAALGAREFFALARAEGAEPLSGPGTALAAMIPILAHGERLAVLRPSTAVAVVAVLALLAIAIWRRGPGGKPAMSVGATLLGVAYAGGGITYAYMLRYHEYTVTAAAGTALLLLPLLLTWSCDTAAYAVGSRWGRRKLIPSVSPGKTIEGAIAGIIVPVIVGLLYVSLVLRPIAQLGANPLSIILFSAVIALTAQIGDLAESLLKRSAGVKDSSNLIPGHGGVLDRFDSLYFVLPVSWLLLRWILVPAPRLT